MTTRPIQPGRSLNAESLRWAMGCFCAFVGAFVLVAPHRFDGPPYEGLAPFRAWWGVASLAGGLGLLTASILRPRRASGFAMHALAGLTLLTLAVLFGTRAGWMGLIFYAFLGISLIVAGLLPLPGTASRPGFEPDLFSLTMGAASLLTGAAMTLFPALFASSAIAGHRLRPLLELGLLATGALLCRVHLRPAPGWLVWTSHLAAGTVLALWGGLIALPLQAWTGVGLFLGCGTFLAFLPGLEGRLARLDTSALRTRLALALASATSLALILTAAVATTQEEQLAERQVLETRQVEAQAIADNVADYVSLNAAHASTLAAMAGRVPMEPAPQRLFLEQSFPRYPGATGLLILDPAGRVVAADGRVPLDAADWRSIAEGVRPDRPVAVQLLSWARENHPHLVLSAPVVGLDGSLAGALVNVIEADSLAQRISRPGSNIYLADGHGRSIVRREGSDPALAGRPLPDGWDREVAAGRRAGVGHLAAFAPVRDLGWWVAVERPRRAALAGVRDGRDLAFVLLLIVVPLAVIGGIVTARRISRPLDALAGAVGELTAGNPAAPLGSSSIGEVARLSAAFAEMRDRLAERTRERERLAAELLARAEALADSDRRKDEFLAMLAHELRNPLGAIANSAWVLAEAGTEPALMNRAVGVIQRQIQHLVRLVDDLLDVSRITRGKVELRRERIDLADVVRHTVETVRPLMDAKDHSLTVDLPAEPLPLDADPTRLEQVLGNLLRNSAKFTDPGGRIGIEVRRDGVAAVLSVRDNGAGIAPDLLPRVFDLFTQGQQSLDRAGAGLGIGLTLVRNLVEMHGGRIEAQSQGEGTGCTMLVRLPLAEEMKNDESRRMT